MAEELTVCFKPSPGDCSGDVLRVHTECGDFPVQLHAQPAKLQKLPRALHFGRVPLGEMARRTLRLDAGGPRDGVCSDFSFTTRLLPLSAALVCNFTVQPLQGHLPADLTITFSPTQPATAVTDLEVRLCMLC